MDSLLPARQQAGRKTYILPLLSGLLLIPAFPPLEQGYLAWFALTPLLWFCLKASPLQALAGGFIFGFPLHTYLNLYLAGVLFNYLPPTLAAFAMAGLIILSSSFSALFALAAAYARRQCIGPALVLALPALWLLSEYARSLSFLGYNIGYLGYTQWGYPALLNLASVYGYWGIPFVMVAFQAILVLGFSRMLRGRALLICMIIPGLLAAGGLFLPQLLPPENEKPPLWTALIQGNSAPEEILSPAGKEVILQRYLELTREAVSAEPRVELVVWPETVVDLHLTGTATHLPAMEDLAMELDVGILYGARVRSGEKLFNSIILLTPGESRFQVYHKQRLVPFVEYFPLEASLNKLLDLDMLLGRYTAGDEIALFEFSGIPLVGVVCFESYFGDYTRLFTLRGGRHLFILTNDAWFGETIGLEQHAQVAAIRAAEMGTGVTQVANSGITISFDGHGRELFRSGKAVRDTFILALNPAGRKTIYRYAGDYFPAFWLLYLIGCGVAARAKKRGKRPGVKTP